MSSSPALGKGKTEAQPFLYAEASQAGTGSPNSPEQDAAQASRREGQIWEAGRQEGETRARAAFEEQLERARENIRTALLEFEQERKNYFKKVEGEAVQLALSIARKVLHREAQVDPLLLAGIVRVALEKIESHTKIIVRVHPLHGTDCRMFFARCMDPQKIPQVEEDPTLEMERCVLQTDLGTTEIGIDVQLKEIEQGLMDLLAHRPQAGN